MDFWPKLQDLQPFSHQKHPFSLLGSWLSGTLVVWVLIFKCLYFSEFSYFYNNSFSWEPEITCTLTTRRKKYFWTEITPKNKGLALGPPHLLSCGIQMPALLGLRDSLKLNWLWPFYIILNLLAILSLGSVHKWKKFWNGRQTCLIFLLQKLHFGELSFDKQGRKGFRQKNLIHKFIDICFFIRCFAFFQISPDIHFLAWVLWSVHMNFI